MTHKVGDVLLMTSGLESSVQHSVRSKGRLKVKVRSQLHFYNQQQINTHHQEQEQEQERHST